MPILNVKIESIGQAGVSPRIIYILTNDTIAEVTATGYLNKIVAGGVALQSTDIALISTKTSEAAVQSQTGFYDVTYASGNWSAQASASTFPLANTHIFVGNASNVATDVALSGDATMANTGAMTIANSAITNAKVSASAAIDFSKLAALASGNMLIGSAGTVPTSVAMTGDTTISNAGVVAIGAGKVLTSMVSPLLIQYATVTVSLANFINMYSVPIQLVAAAGANTQIILSQMQIQQTYGSAALASGGVAAVQYDSTIQGAGVIASTTLSAATFQQTASSTYTMNPGVVVLPFATTVNKGLYLSCLTGNFTTGTGSTFKIHVWYSVVPSI